MYILSSFDCLRYFVCFMLNISQILRSIQTGALGIRLSRHGLATALVTWQNSALLANLKNLLSWVIIILIINLLNFLFVLITYIHIILHIYLHFFVSWTALNFWRLIMFMRFEYISNSLFFAWIFASLMSYHSSLF